jgi:Asp-tRNA(Asn)/Glu-tRNA(Gln) amidotransferase A subunit family amidase
MGKHLNSTVQSCKIASELDIGVIGPIARSARDLAIVLDLLAIPDSYDSGSLKDSGDLEPDGLRSRRNWGMAPRRVSRLDLEVFSVLATALGKNVMYGLGDCLRFLLLHCMARSGDRP